MIPIQSDHPPGTVILATASMPRYAEFWESLALLRVPKGTEFRWAKGYDACDGRNRSLEQRSGEWSFFLDDDHTFPSDVLLHLLDLDVNAVAPLACRRAAPYDPIVCHGDGSGAYSWDEIPRGIVRLPHGDYTGMGCFLVRESILRKMTPPWFRVGQYRPGHMEEDRWFCDQIWKVGDTIFLDAACAIGHTNTVTYIPHHTENGWEINGR